MKPAPDVLAYQQAFAQSLGVPHALAFWKGRVALYAILKAMGVGPGDEVILPGYTCVMAVNPIVYLGATPVFVDIEPVTYNMDPNQVDASVTPRTRLIIAQHTYGYPADLRAIQDISTRRGVPFIEDCCLSMGSTVDGRETGTWGVAAYFSSQWNKPYTTGLGGMAATRDAALAQRMAELQERDALEPGAREVRMLRAQLAVYRSLIYPRTTALAQSTFRALTRLGVVVGSSSSAEFTPRMEPDFFKGMSALQARAGLRQITRRSRIIAHRERLSSIYAALLDEAGRSPPRLPPHVRAVLVRYPVRVRDKDAALQQAAGRFVELGSWFESPLHPKETPLEAYDYHEGMCPNADRACREVVNMPVHPRAGESTARRTVRFLSSIGFAG